MENKNAIFQEEFNFTFTDKKSIINIIINMLVLALFAYLSSPLYDTTSYFKQGIQPLSATAVAISTLLVLFFTILRKESLSLDNKQVTNLKIWVHRSPLSAGQIIIPNILFALWFSFFLITLSFPILIISFTSSGAGPGSMIACIVFLYIFTFIFQIISLIIRYLSDNQGVYISLWIVIILVLGVSFSLFTKSNPFSTISGFFSNDAEMYPPLEIFKASLPYYTRGFIAAIIILAVSLSVFRIQLAFGKRGDRK